MMRNTFHFMSLPLEIRYLIYEIIWCTPILISLSRQLQNPFISLLATSAQIKAEVITWYRKYKRSRQTDSLVDHFGIVNSATTSFMREPITYHSSMWYLGAPLGEIDTLWLKEAFSDYGWRSQQIFIEPFKAWRPLPVRFPETLLEEIHVALRDVQRSDGYMTVFRDYAHLNRFLDERMLVKKRLYETGALLSGSVCQVVDV